ncbi:LPS biosynthesis protein [Candidatus Daviesbacteria bacterium RIFCSPHIGHO2_02_FULL_36_13]|uniref:LPS biosynthesis protein n=1 Tax=Candidatus Daviesbacteria bacterium RIFCSPHIGHO2_02_FULL_36_13 TaxID=1797768 RepID=A0A1F5JPS5_9BACT|nr:MAG: LPS biosynthesis protein [Candidatus Daviesbacteria bacterium RIFCSPHIGHO2_02_FULL_36_13]
MKKTLDKQLLNRPQEVIFCKKCVVSNQRPRITFDSDGVCSACKYAYRKHHEIDWNEREQMLGDLLKKHRSKDGSYDCIVPVSGGKDSGYVAHLLKYKYGMHPLTVTWAPFLYTDIGWNNFIKFKDSGFDNLLFTPNGKIHRKLSRLAFELHGDAWDPFGYGQKSFAFHAAVKFNIKLIFYGENGEVEYGGSLKYIDQPYESPEDFKEHYFKGSGVDELVKAGLKSGIFTKDEASDRAFDIYKVPAFQQMNKLNPEMHWMSFYKKWVPQENFYYAAEHTGFKANPERSEGTYSKYASLDDKTDGFHWYLGYIKFGMGRTSRDAQMEIRNKHISREEAIALVRRYDGEFPKKYFAEFLEYLGITEKEFWEIIEFYRKSSPHLWKKVKGEWRLTHNVWGGGTDD